MPTAPLLVSLTPCSNEKKAVGRLFCLPPLPLVTEAGQGQRSHRYAFRSFFLSHSPPPPLRLQGGGEGGFSRLRLVSATGERDIRL